MGRPLTSTLPSHTKLTLLHSWTYVQSDAPEYFTGHSINLGGNIGVLVLSLFGIFYCLRENKLRARGKRDHRLEGLTEAEQTDLGYRHPEFRYMP